MKEKLKEWKDKVLTPERVQDLKNYGRYVFGGCMGMTILAVYMRRHMRYFMNKEYYLFDRKGLDE